LKAAQGENKLMKLMKHITIALVICAIPAVAFGQLGVVIDGAKAVVVCPKDECYAAPYFAGTGGFVAMGSKMDDADTADKNEAMDTVAVAVSCGNVVETMEFTPDEDGMVRQAFDETNGLACAAGGGSFVIHGIEEGGWYWINDTMSSAVGSLVPLNVYGNARITPVDPGGVTITPAAMFSASEPEGIATAYMSAASYVSHEASGRVGIIPHILPTEPIATCGPLLQNNCTVRASYSIGLALGTGGKVGAGVTRGDEAVTVTPSVAALGELAGDAIGNFKAVIAGTGHGVTTEDTETETVVSIEAVVPGAGRCADNNIDRDTPIKVTFSFLGGADGYVPAVGALADRSITVHCPEVEVEDSANQGVNLVPENPFPVE
jgi:hypothetical protein